jgi:cyclase
MALAHRIIPSVLCRGRTLVKGKMFRSWRSVGVAAQAVRIHAARGVDQVMLLDIGATPENRRPDLALVEELAAELFCPLAVGGGVRTVQDVKDLLRAGADSVVIGTAAIEDPSLLPKLRDTVGSQAITVAIDYADGLVAKHCGKFLTSIPVVPWARSQALHGAGEFLLTSVRREGTCEGYDLKTLREVAQAVNIPVVAHGGCGSYEHMREAIDAGAAAVAAGAFFQFEDATPKGAARYLQSRGIEVRV